MSNRTFRGLSGRLIVQVKAFVFRDRILRVSSVALRSFFSSAPLCSSVLLRSRPMAEALAAEINIAQEAVTKQADTVRSLKADVKAGKIEKVYYVRAGWS